MHLSNFNYNLPTTSPTPEESVTNPTSFWDIKTISEWSEILHQILTQSQTTEDFELNNSGIVISVGDGIAKVYGLLAAKAGEILDLGQGIKG